MPTTINIEYSKAVNITTGETWITIKSGNTILEGENPIEAFKKILEDNNACHHLAAQPQVRQQQKESIGTDEDIYAMMDKCTTVEELKGWFLPANTNGKSLLYYNNKLKQLSNG